MANAFLNQHDRVTLVCRVKKQEDSFGHPKHNVEHAGIFALMEASNVAEPERGGGAYEEISTSREILAQVSPVFADAFAGNFKGHRPSMIIPHFSPQDMSLFLKYAAYVVLQIDDLNLDAADSYISREVVIKILPIVDYYACELLWHRLASWILKKPDLELFALAEDCTFKIDWDDRVYGVVTKEFFMGNSKEPGEFNMKIKQDVKRMKVLASLSRAVVARLIARHLKDLESVSSLCQLAYPQP